MEALRSYLSDGDREDEVEHCKWVAAELFESKLDAVLLPTAEGVDFPCSWDALQFFDGSLAARLCGSNRVEKMRGDSSSHPSTLPKWTDGCNGAESVHCFAMRDVEWPRPCLPSPF